LDLALQRRRLQIAMTVTAVALIVALIAAACAFGLHVRWMIWVFLVAILAGFGSHGWLILGVLREKPAS
jgi:hypothetical protein